MPSDEFITPSQNILSKLSFSHITEIMTQDDPLARFFYETECIKGTWSVGNTEPGTVLPGDRLWITPCGSLRACPSSIK